ncbi:MAG: hypothetical protein ACRDP1_02440 [Nocardioidaceae bacterium]
MYRAVIFLVGAAVVTFGAVLIYLPAGLMLGGAILCVCAWALEVESAQRPEESARPEAKRPFLRPASRRTRGTAQ